MGKYLFRLETMHVNAKRNQVKNNQDCDVITFGIEVGPKQYGPLKDYNSYSADTGTDLDFGKFPGMRARPDGAQQGRWEIGPIEVVDTDIVSVNYGVVNAN